MVVVVVIRAMLFYFMENISLDIDSSMKYDGAEALLKMRMRTKQSKGRDHENQTGGESVE